MLLTWCNYKRRSGAVIHGPRSSMRAQDNLFESCVLSSCGSSTLRISISESSMLVANRARFTRKSIRCFPLWSLNLNLIAACRFVYRIIARTREMKHVLWIQIYFISLFSLASLRTFFVAAKNSFLANIIKPASSTGFEIFFRPARV